MSLFPSFFTKTSAPANTDAASENDSVRGSHSFKFGPSKNPSEKKGNIRDRDDDESMSAFCALSFHKSKLEDSHRKVDRDTQERFIAQAHNGQLQVKHTPNFRTTDVTVHNTSKSY